MTLMFFKNKTNNNYLKLEKKKGEMKVQIIYDILVKVVFL